MVVTESIRSLHTTLPIGRQLKTGAQDPRLDLYKEVHWANLGQKSACVGVNGLNMYPYQTRAGNDKPRI